MNKKTAAGFTLLEMIVAMAIIAIFVGTAASFASRRTSEEFLELESSLHAYIQDTRTLAINEQAAYYIHFKDNKFWRSKDLSIQSDNESAFEFPQQASLLIYIDEKWTQISKEKTYSWLFSRSGVCEPCSIRLNFDGASLETAFDPLTAIPIAHEG